MKRQKGFCGSVDRVRNGGFTVVEFMVTLVLGGVSLALAIPSLQTFTADNQVIAATNSIVTGLNTARSTAITTGGNVSICPSSNLSGCSDNNWEKGWIIYADTDGDNTADADEIIRVMQIEGKISDSGFGSQIVFTSNGTTTMGSGATMTHCFSNDKISTKCMDISVSAFGTITSAPHYAEEEEQGEPS